ncbi:hypothetical protein CR156_06680 [Stenotrophomonas lactitubi]|uniref:hypothetical protein n=1 Tax=Stenotrophomonas lactitubi TaxID=2045214 RepID=UPI000C273FB4|nr:hypothetical protein [Stenotrophomonas lactitubi]PJO51905.1 hypothetical protein CR156_06680 [Stenotrophomonas lactitubi]
MTIEFLQLEHTTTDGRAAALLALRVVGVGQGVGAAGSVVLSLGSSGRGQIYFGGGVDPVIPANGAAALNLGTSGRGYYRDVGGGAAAIRLRARGFQTASGRGAGGARLVLHDSGRQVTAPMAYAGLSARPRMISAFGGRWFASPRSSLAVGETRSSMPTHVLNEVLSIDESRRSALLASCRTVDTLSLEDAAAVVFMLLVEEGVSFSSEIHADAIKLERVIDRLLVLGIANSYADALNALVGGLWFGALTEALRTETVIDGLLGTEVVASLQRAAERVVDGMLADTAAFEVGTGVVMVDEQLLVGAAGGATAELAQLLRDGVGFVTRLALDTGEYVAWVMNTESRALSRYTQYPFNSFAKIGGRYYAAAADGLHRLDGDDDDGTPIAARLRLGLSALGTRRLKRLPEAFVGYTASGALLLHVITVNEQSGQKEAAIYRILERPASSERETRWKLGKGIKAVDFDFVIENVDGADFELAAIDFRPIYLDRRTRG